MNYESLKNRYLRVKEKFFHEEQIDLLDDLNKLYDARISIINTCVDCDSRVFDVCVKHNQPIPDLEKIPDYCLKDSFEELMNLLDTIREENYVRAHFKRGEENENKCK